MKHTLELHLQRGDGALVRTLGLIERRGFAVNSLSTSPQGVDSELALVVEVESAHRSVDVLTRQIAKLYDVRAVSLTDVDECILVLKGSVAAC